MVEQKRVKREAAKKAADEAKRKRAEAKGEAGSKVGVVPEPEEDGCIIDNLLKEIRAGTTLKSTGRKGTIRKKASLSSSDLGKLNSMMAKAASATPRASRAPSEDRESELPTVATGHALSPVVPGGRGKNEAKRKSITMEVLDEVNNALESLSDPVNPIPEPVKPSSEPANPIPEPVKPSSEPANPIPEPVKPSSEPANPIPEPAQPSPQPQATLSTLTEVLPPQSTTTAEMIAPLVEGNTSTVHPATPTAPEVSPVMALSECEPHGPLTPEISTSSASLSTAAEPAPPVMTPSSHQASAIYPPSTTSFPANGSAIVSSSTNQPSVSTDRIPTAAAMTTSVMTDTSTGDKNSVPSPLTTPTSIPTPAPITSNDATGNGVYTTTVPSDRPSHTHQDLARIQAATLDTPMSDTPTVANGVSRVPVKDFSSSEDLPVW